MSTNAILTNVHSVPSSMAQSSPLVVGKELVHCYGKLEVVSGVTLTRLLQSGLCLKINAAGMLGFSCT